jgi:hypothetical protein
VGIAAALVAGGEASGAVRGAGVLVQAVNDTMELEAIPCATRHQPHQPTRAHSAVIPNGVSAFTGRFDRFSVWLAILRERGLTAPFQATV